MYMRELDETVYYVHKKCHFYATKKRAHYSPLAANSHYRFIVRKK